MKNKTKIVLILLIILVLALVAVLAEFKLKLIKKETTQQNSQSSSQIITTKYTEGQIPQGWPTDIPVEQGAKITENFSMIGVEGIKRSIVKEFESKKTLQENYDIYKQYLNKNGYVAEDDISQDTQKIISATKDGYRLRVRIYQTENNIVRVSLNYIEL